MSSGTWVPEDQRDTRYYIFKQLFMVRVNDLARRNLKHIEAHGVRITGNRDYDRSVKEELCTCYLPISELAVYHDQGVSIYLVKPSDAKVIYELVHEHLSNWMKYLEEQIGIGDAPIEDLLILDNFANTVYPSAARFFPNGKPEDVFSKASRSITKFFIPLDQQVPLAKKPDPEAEPETPVRKDGFGSVLREYQDIKDFRWK